MRKDAFWAIALVVFFGILVALAYWPKPVKVDAKPAPCVAAANEICPSAEWLKDYEDWKKLDDEIKTSENPKKDLRTGWAARLNDSMPPGYYFNLDTKKFQKRELPTPVPAPHK